MISLRGESISSTAEEALKLGVADIVVDRMNELLEKLDGRVLTVNGRTITLDTGDAEVIEQRFTLRERILARITDPNIAYLLMLLGIFGIFFELQNPGAIFPGVVGGIAILVDPANQNPSSSTDRFFSRRELQRRGTTLRQRML